MVFRETKTRNKKTILWGSKLNNTKKENKPGNDEKDTWKMLKIQPQ